MVVCKTHASAVLVRRTFTQIKKTAMFGVILYGNNSKMVAEIDNKAVVCKSAPNGYISPKLHLDCRG